jgi:hypothetical protein
VRLEVRRGPDALRFLEGLPPGFCDLLLVDCTNSHLRRHEVVRAARGAVKPGGWIVLDNSDHPQNWLAADLLRGYPCRSFTGYSPMTLSVGRTSFWKV